MNVLSLFDGMSCGQVALAKAGIQVDSYFASEVDKYAIKIAMKNFPKTIQLGDVCTINTQELPKIDLLIGGSPCQGFSFAGKGLNFDDSRSRLFFEYVRLKDELKPRYFLLENVRMKKESQQIISDLLGVEPVLINSSLLSAQSRNRLYWTNIPFNKVIEDKNLFWDGVQLDHASNCYYVTTKMQKWIHSSEKRISRFKVYDKFTREKMQMVEASHHKGISNQRCFAINDGGHLRYIHPIECERLQTLPDNYTEGVSNTQRYKMIGNGWTVDVISHILKGIQL